MENNAKYTIKKCLLNTIVFFTLRISIRNIEKPIIPIKTRVPIPNGTPTNCTE